MKNKRVLRATAVLLGMVTLLTGVVFGLKSSVNIDDDPIALGGTEVSEDFLVHQTEDDVRIIPDKYNTGAKGTLINVELGGKVGDIQLVAGSGGTKNVFDFYYRNKNIDSFHRVTAPPKRTYGSCKQFQDCRFGSAYRLSAPFRFRGL